jgi:N-acetylglucosaminyl-diphospho-decaprenol L-rhamnosyltransferase
MKVPSAASVMATAKGVLRLAVELAIAGQTTRPGVPVSRQPGSAWTFVLTGGTGTERGREKTSSIALVIGMSTTAERADTRVEERPDLSVIEERPDLSVIVVTHNRAELALATLRSARAAVRDLDVEWIVVDSGSSDETPDAIESACAGVRVVRERNIGFAAANNRGLQFARGRYVLLLNPDVETVAGTFDELVATLDERREIGVASVVQNAPDGTLQYSVRRFPSAWLALGEALGAARWTPLRRWREEENRAPLYRTEASADWLVGAFLIARAQALAEVGPLDERFFLYSEETDWCFRFHQAGWVVAHLPLMSVTHHSGHAPGPDLSAQQSYAKILFARKHYGRMEAGAIRAALALRHALRAALATVAGRSRPQWAARATVERRALAVVLGTAEPPFAQVPAQANRA